MAEPLRVLSLGAGVQSTTLLLMAEAEGWAPDAAIFADTGWEPQAVYDHLARLETTARTPIHRVTGGNLRVDLVSKVRFAAPPLFVRVGSRARMLHRQCTRDYKVRPIRRWCQQERRGRPVEMWLGISLDESQRMRDSDVAYITNRYPLVDRRMSRADCVAWLSAHGFSTPPKSACIGCPFHSDSQWRAIRADPVAWADAIEVDEAIRDLPLVQGDAFLHRSLKPLPVVSLSPEDDGQIGFGFENECAGVCGV